jgi:hypothetical protein
MRASHPAPMECAGGRGGAGGIKSGTTEATSSATAGCTSPSRFVVSTNSLRSWHVVRVRRIRGLVGKARGLSTCRNLAGGEETHALACLLRE